MTETYKPRWQISVPSGKAIETHDQVKLAQQYLKRFGYLAPEHKSETFDYETKDALGNFQLQSAIPVTKELDEKTVNLMNSRRCGLPLPGFGLLPLNSVHSWHVKRRFTYRFINGTNDLAGNAERQAIQNAFATWAAATGITFTQVNAAPSDFEIEWATGTHGGAGHTAFDGVGNVLAHAFYPPPSGGRDTGQMHFDDSEVWALTGGTNTDLEAVALHEIGHLLGLDHTSDNTAVMFAFYSAGLVNLTTDDLRRIRRLYPRGRLWHSIRDGNPWTQFADVERAAGERGNFSTVACASMGRQLHVCGITDDGRLWHSIREGNPWTQFADVEGAAGERGRFVNVACAAMGNQLHVCAITDDGRLWHSIRQGNPWSPFADVESAAGERGRFVHVTCAAMNNQLHVCAITDDGRFWHSIREGNPWTQFADIEGAAGERGQFISASCAAMGNQLHVCAITTDGRIWHSIRQGNPWTPLADVEGAAGERGRFVHVSCATIDNQLHVPAITDDGRIWHSIRQGNPWSQFADVEGAAGERGDFCRVACAGMGTQLHVCAVAV